MNRRNFLRTGAVSMAVFSILPCNILGGVNFIQTLKWHPEKEEFFFDREANRLRSTTIQGGV